MATDRTAPRISAAPKKGITPTQREFLLVLEDHLGVVSPACKEFGIDRARHYEWREKFPEYKAACEELNNLVLDFAENQLYARVKEKSDTAIIFLLKTRGKSRGYIERTEHDVSISSADREARGLIAELLGTSAAGDTPGTEEKGGER